MLAKLDRMTVQCFLLTCVKQTSIFWPFWHVCTCMNMLKRCLPTGGREGGMQGLHEKGREVGFGK